MYGMPEMASMLLTMARHRGGHGVSFLPNSVSWLAGSSVRIAT